MVANGWNINVDRDNSNCSEAICPDIHNACEANTFYGLIDSNHNSASVSAKMKGSGKLQILSANCNDQGTGSMYFNNDRYATANTKQIISYTRLPYKSGDVLKIIGYGGAIIKLYYFYVV